MQKEWNKCPNCTDNSLNAIEPYNLSENLPFFRCNFYYYFYCRNYNSIWQYSVNYNHVEWHKFWFYCQLECLNNCKVILPSWCSIIRSVFGVNRAPIVIYVEKNNNRKIKMKLIVSDTAVHTLTNHFFHFSALNFWTRKIKKRQNGICKCLRMSF